MIDENLDQTESLEPEIEQQESVEDTVARAFAEASGEINEPEAPVQGDQGPSKPEVNASEAARILASSKKGKFGKAKKVVEAADLEPVTPAPVEPPLSAPQSWKIEEKDWFNKQPREAQQAILRREAERDAYFTKTSQELQRERQKFGECNQLLEQAALEWGHNGITPASGLSQLLAMQKLLATDTKQGLAKIMQLNNVTIHDLADYVQQGGQQSYQPQPQQQQNIPLTPDAIRQMILETQQQQAEQAYLQQAAADVESMALENGPTGQPVWPELRQPMQVERVKSLVKDLVERTHPGISIVEATKRAIFTIRTLDGTLNGSPAAAISPRLPTQANDLARAKGAAVSVRGRGNASVSNTYQAKPGERVEDTIRATLAQFNS